MHSPQSGGNPAIQNAVRDLERLNPDQFEIYFQRKVSTSIDSKEQNVDSLTQSEDVGLAIRVIRDHRMGFSFTTSLDPRAITQAAQSAFDVAQIMPEDEHVGLASFSTAVYPAIDSLDLKGLQAPVADKIGLAKKLEAICRKVDKRITAVRKATFGEMFYEVQMVDSTGELLSHQSTLFTASITCKAEQGGDSQMAGDFGFSNTLDTLALDEVGRTAAEQAVEQLGAEMPATMTCPAVLRNDVVSELIDFMSASFSAEEIEKGRSLLAGKQGERIFAESITLIDDGLMPGGIGTTPFDGEGVPCTRTTLIDGGFYATPLYNTYYARKLGAKPTGSSTRGIKTPPTIGFSNLYLKKGRKSLADLCDGIDKGVLISGLMGIHTANPVTGDFSVGASGFLIEKGKIGRPIKGFAIAGNILDIFRRTTDVGSDLRFFGPVGAPSIRVSEISVGGK